MGKLNSKINFRKFWNFLLIYLLIWKPRKTGLESPTKPKIPPTRSDTSHSTPKMDDHWVENEVEREISERSECSRKLKCSGLGWKRYPRPLKTCFLNSTMIICLHFSRSTTKLARFTPTRKVILLVEDFPGFVGLSNPVFRRFQNFTIDFVKKIKWFRQLFEQTSQHSKRLSLEQQYWYTFEIMHL